MKVQNFVEKTEDLINSLKGVCANYGLGNDGNEFKVITQIFLYKFINDKFIYELRKIDKGLGVDSNIYDSLNALSDSEYSMLLLKLNPSSAKLKRNHFLSFLYNNQNQEEFYKLFDDTLRDIAIFNNDIFSVKTAFGSKITLFTDEISKFVEDDKDSFCKALINQITNFSFENIFDQKFDFFSTIFEYLIKDYNKDGGGKYAEYYTPHSVAKIMASILVLPGVKNVTCYDPSAGSGTLLMNLAHSIGEDNCTIYSQDISIKSSGMLRLNLILNNLVHSIQNIIQGNTLTNPYHKEENKLAKFDYIISNPPFKTDFSDYRNNLETNENHERFFAGIPTIPKKAVEKMAIYLLFIQHIMFSLKKEGKAAIVVPTGFLTASNGIELRIKEKLVKEKMLRGVITMPSNIFATTSTNVSILFLDKTNDTSGIIFMDASSLGTTIKEGKNQKTILSEDEANLIIETFNKKEKIDDFSVILSCEEIEKKNYSFSAGQYFDIKIKFENLTHNEFLNKIEKYNNELNYFFENSRKIEENLQEILKKLKM